MTLMDVLRPDMRTNFATSGMTAGWFHELRRRIEAEANKEAMAVGNGSCVSGLDQSGEQIGMMYRERVGFILGLKRALDIAGNVEAGREVD